ncbi:3-isopropylmalate dehydratase small subunit [Cerasicoccus arenae]|uniref:3-isopropylmalate dehydratase n=1 Tax=Cerasicoccus arenae TaxID=424488 RepID=A0A8J3DGX1_9BACT|nr:3-isopropylmalate dehydratase small subunit [Cerasicoccus arenae]MBK1857683.1 3-isopropylmalate dehydratase small subunit [Cerasicoccus arenae]GHB91393.1 3-isopropylmalate dehydratase small subunit [Cerasicoccus arenae]
MNTLPAIKQVSGRAVPVPGDDVDTDRIIPARFMKCVTFDGLGEFAFYDVRFDGDGNKKKHPLNEARFDGASIMLVGSNFGCGSSREHAPQSLHKFGVRALIGLSYAEIFFGNSTTLGIPCVSVDEKTLHTLVEIVESHPETELKIDLETKKITAAGNEFPLTIAESAREGLLSAEWDALALLMKDPADIETVAERLHYV